MSRKFIATVLAVSVTITGFSAAPSRAMTEDQLMGALLGVGALVIIGSALKNSRSNPAPAPVYHAPAPTPLPAPDPVETRRLPQKCLKTFDDRYGQDTRIFTRRCLERNFRFAHSLPNACSATIYTTRGQRNGYRPRCLRRHGYRFNRT